MKHQLITLTIIGLIISCKDLKKNDVENIKHIKPNVIYILADDLGYGDLGCYGQKMIQTPKIDQMAKEGMLFTDHYAGNTVCAPSRATLLTGLHQGHAPIRGNNKNSLKATEFTLAQMFKQAGYTTSMIGKWGLGQLGTSGVPNKHGFDTYFGYLNQIRAHNYYPDYLIKNGKKIILSNEVVFATEGYAKDIGQAATVKNEYSHALFMKEALRFLETPKQKPFFLYLPFTIPHANNEGTLTAKHGMEVPDLGIYVDKEWPEAEKSKAAMISLLDSDVGRILDKVKEMGLDENTLIIFTSDNGPHSEGGVDPDFFDSNGPLKGIKRDLYEGGIRVPFIARWPHKIAKNSKSDLPTAFWDMMPTFAEVAGQVLNHENDGISFVPTLFGNKEDQNVHDYLYWEFATKPFEAQAIRSGEWKLVHIHATDSWELYNLSTDIGEKTNVVLAHPEVALRLKTYMKEAHVFDKNYPFEVELAN